MIDAVGTLSVQSAALRVMPQNSSSFASAGEDAASLYSNLPKLGTRLYVRIDSAAERAILEVRSSETGEVVNQYPSEAQMRAFERAARLDAARDAEQARDAAVRESRQNGPAADAPEMRAPQAQAAPDIQPAPAPQTMPVPEAVNAPSVVSGGPSFESGSEGRSVVV